MGPVTFIFAGIAAGAAWMSVEKPPEPARFTGMLRCQKPATATDPGRYVIGLEQTGSKSNPIVLDLSAVKPQADGLVDRLVVVTATMRRGQYENIWTVSAIEAVK